jgi:hypothetical protein
MTSGKNCLVPESMDAYICYYPTERDAPQSVDDFRL